MKSRDLEVRSIYTNPLYLRESGKQPRSYPYLWKLTWIGGLTGLVVCIGLTYLQMLIDSKIPVSAITLVVFTFSGLCFFIIALGFTLLFANKESNKRDIPAASTRKALKQFILNESVWQTQSDAPDH